MYMPDITKSPSAIEQISTMIERDNTLVEDVKDLETIQKKKNQEIALLKLKKN